MNIARRLRRPVLLAAALFCASASVASASSISAFSGNTQPAKGTGDAATVNFAVYDRAGGSAGDTFNTGLAGFDSLFTAGSGSAAFDTSASYLYLYQTVANGGLSVFENTVGVVSPIVTSFGSFTGTSFSDTVLGSPAGFSNTSPASTGATPTINGSVSDAVAPSLLIDGSSSVQAYFFSEIPAGGKSILWGYTSNVAPQIGNTAILETTGANGSAATAIVPIPPALCSGGLLIGAIALAKTRRRLPSV